MNLSLASLLYTKGLLTCYYHPPNDVCETNSAKLQNCNCIRLKKKSQFLKLQCTLKIIPGHIGPIIRQVQRHKENYCLKAEDCNCIFKILPEQFTIDCIIFGGGDI